MLLLGFAGLLLCYACLRFGMYPRSTAKPRYGVYEVGYD
jgi:uncharacterized membrane protein SpoIIM required for sporulation